MTVDHLSSPESYRIQKTLRAPIEFEGVGLHSGVKSRLEIHPAEPNQGISFVRKDIKKSPRIPAHYDSVINTTLATSLGSAEEPRATIGTVEHVMAALYGMGITNAVLELKGPEIPILDGSAEPFLDAIHDTGFVAQSFTTPTLRVIKPVKIFQEGAICELLPRERLRLTTSIDFPHPSIGLQTFAVELTPRVFNEEVSSARTFGFLKDVEKLKKKQLAQGASLENVLAFNDKEVVNPGGMRFADECVRHKLLDALGDLALCGSWIQGELVSYRGGHSIHLALLKALKATPTHWEMLPAQKLAASLPFSSRIPLEATALASS